jgi:hypothetical protein
MNNNNEYIEVYTDLEENSNLKGYIQAKIKGKKGNFYLVEYNINGFIHTKIFTPEKIRKNR